MSITRFALAPAGASRLVGVVSTRQATHSSPQQTLQRALVQVGLTNQSGLRPCSAERPSSRGLGRGASHACGCAPGPTLRGERLCGLIAEEDKGRSDEGGRPAERARGVDVPGSARSGRGLHDPSDATAAVRGLRNFRARRAVSGRSVPHVCARRLALRALQGWRYLTRGHVLPDRLPGGLGRRGRWPTRPGPHLPGG